MKYDLIYASLELNQDTNLNQCTLEQQELPSFLRKIETEDLSSLSTKLVLKASAWSDMDELREHAEHLPRPNPFVSPQQPAYVLFWIPQGYNPTAQEITERFYQLQREGPTCEAFTFEQNFNPNKAQHNTFNRLAS